MHYIRKIGLPKLKRSQSPTARPGKTKKDGGNGDLCSKLNVNEEYKEVFRTKSYTEISSKVEGQLMSRLSIDRLSSSSSPTPIPFNFHLSECLLEPSQQAAIDTVQSSTIHSLLMDYFNCSFDACRLCELLLQSIHKTRSNYKYIQRAIKIANGNNHHLQDTRLSADFSSFASLSNPLSIISTEQFSNIHERFSLLLHQLISKHREIRRKMKIVRFCKKVLGYGLVASYSVLAVALLMLAVHSIVGLMGVPGLLMAWSFGVSRKRRKTGQAGLRASQPKLLCGQLDLAARGIYILVNQLDTMDRLVARLDDEVQHKKAIAGMCVKNYRRGQEVPREAVRELEMHEDGFLEQLDELQKHVYFCFLTINRSRKLVIQEIMASLDS